MKKLTIPAVCAFLTLVNCDEKDPVPTEIIINGNLESGVSFPTGWGNFVVGNGTYEFLWDNQVANSSPRSISIKNEGANPESFAYWYQTICKDIPVGKKLVLKAKVKGELTGQGISIALRADGQDPSANSEFVSTQNFQKITGTFDWGEYGVEMVSVPDYTKCLLVFLVYLPNTTGEVHFDDVSLAFEN